MRRLVSRLRSVPQRRSTRATSFHRRSAGAIGGLGSRLADFTIAARRPRPGSVRVARPGTGVRAAFLSNPRTLPIVVALLVLIAAFVTAGPNLGQPPVVGAAEGTESTEPRLEIAGLVGGVDAEIGTANQYLIDDESADEAADEAVIEARLAAADEAPDPGDSIAGPFLDDGTLLKPVAVDTTVTDASDMIREYRVRSGDTLTGIANRYGVSMMTIWWANDLDSKSDLHVGQKLVIPPVDGLVVTVTDGDTLDSLAAANHVGPDEILAVNELDDPNLIIGQVLLVPGARGDAIATPTPAPTKAPAKSSTKSNSTKSPSRTTPKKSTGGGGGGGGGGRFVWPVVGGGNYISQYYHYGHYGIDIAADYGSRVRAASGGTVTFAGWKSNGGGYQVWISHGSGVYTTYNHMSAVTVRRGQSVGRGTQVGRVGQSGWATGPHLHFEVWKGPVWNGGTRVNPLRYF